MRVLVTGAYGLIGSACLAGLYDAGYDLVAAGRSTKSARRRFDYADWIEADFGKLTDARAWLPLLAGIDAVVNCVGVLQDGARDDVQRVQFAGTAALFDACAQAGVKRVIHISAIGAETTGPSAFSRTKADVEIHLKALPLEWVILRPGLVFASAVYGGTAMLRGIAAIPGCVPLIGADARVQIIDVDDVAATVVGALSPGAPARVVWDVTHPQVHTIAEIVIAIRGWLGFPPRRLLRLPDFIATAVAAVADALGWLGWRSPVRTTSFAQLGAGVVGDPAGWMEATGIRPKSLNRILATRPASVQDRWHARLYLLKPFAIAGLVVAAFTVGALQFFTSWKIAAAMRPGLSAELASHMAAGLAFGAVAIALGLGLVVRKTARCALIGLLVFALLRAASDILTSLHFGFFPFGVLSFQLPILLAVLFTLSILDER